jgi:hypothetical protein
MVIGFLDATRIRMQLWISCASALAGRRCYDIFSGGGTNVWKRCPSNACVEKPADSRAWAKPNGLSDVKMGSYETERTPSIRIANADIGLLTIALPTFTDGKGR